MATAKKPPIPFSQHINAIKSALEGVTDTIHVETRVHYDPKLEDYFMGENYGYGPNANILLRFTIKKKP